MLTTPMASATRAQPGCRRRPAPPCENQSPYKSPEDHPMDIEQVNAIGTLLADLSARTEQLRGYL